MKKINKDILFSLIATIAYFLVVFLIYDVTYELNDDVMIINILSGRISGAYSASYYMSIELGAVISALYRLLPAIPWYGAFMTSLYILSFFIIIYKVLSSIEKIKFKIFGGIFAGIIYTALFLRSFVLLHYTVVAAFIGAVGIIILLTGDIKKSFDWILPVVMFLISYLIRENVAFMLLPFTGLAFMYVFLKDKDTDIKERVRKYAGYVGIYLGAFIVLLLINRVLPFGNEWKEYKVYNDVRTSVYDYVGIFDEDDKAIEYYKNNGLTDNDISLYKSYDLMLEDEEAYDKLEIFSGYSQVKKQTYSDKQRLKDAVYIYYRRIFKEGTDAPFDIIIILLYVVAFNAAIVLRKREVILPVLLSGVYRSLFFIYLLYQGRYPERVITALFIIEIAFLLSVIIDMLRKTEASKLTLYGYVTVLFITFSYLAVSEVGTLTDRYKHLVSVNSADDVIYSYMENNPDKYYFVDVFTTVEHTEKALALNKKTKTNYVLLGGWLYKHPVLNRFYANIGYSNGLEALRDNEDYYLVTREQLSPTKEAFEGWLKEDLEVETIISVIGSESINLLTGETDTNDDYARRFIVYHVAGDK